MWHNKIFFKSLKFTIYTLPEHQGKGRSNKKNKKKKRTRPHLKEVTVAQACQGLCSAYYKVSVSVVALE